MQPRAPFALPPDKERVLAAARRLEIVSIVALVLISAAMYAVMGRSQAMKTAWVEDVLSLVPPLVFLISTRYRKRGPSARFPYGLARLPLLAFLAASGAVLLLGLYLLYDSASTLVRVEHPSIGTTEWFGMTFWAGWSMMAVLALSAVPPVILGHLKQRPARELHDKTLDADSAINRADWMTALAGVVGLGAVGFGWWWGDAAAAGLIALDVVRDGVRHTKRATALLLDQRPTTVERDQPENVERTVAAALETLPWIRRAAVRLREQGHIFTGEAFVVPEGDLASTDQVEEAMRAAGEVDWRVHDVAIVIVGDRWLDG